MQNPETLLKQLETTPEAEKAPVLLNLALSFLHTQPAQAVEYSQQALELAHRYHAVKYIADALRILGIAHHYQYEYSHALENYLNALTHYEALGDSRGIYIVSNNISAIYQIQSQYEKALTFLLKALTILDDLGSREELGAVYNNIGLLYEEQRVMDKALEYLFKALKVRQESGNTEGVAQTYNNIGMAYYHHRDYGRALEYLHKALEGHATHDNQRSTAVTCTNLGIVYDARDDLDQALVYQKKAVAIFKELGDEHGLTAAYENIGQLEIHRRNYDDALFYLMESLKIAQRINAKKRETDACRSLAELFERLEKHQQALVYYKRYVFLKEELFSVEKSTELAKLQLQYEIDKKEKEAEIYRFKNVELETENQRRREAEDQLRQANAELARINTEKNEFIQLVVHGLKNPLTAIRGNAQNLLQVGLDMVTRQDIETALKKIEHISDRMFDLIVRLLDIDRLESGRAVFDIAALDMRVPLMEVIADSMRKAQPKGINITFDIPDDPVIIHADRDAIVEIFDNLISNSIKFSHAEKTVHIHVVTTKNDAEEAIVRCLVRDEGQGFTSNDLKNLFKRFAKLSAQPTGDEHSTGLGLALVKGLVEAMNGQISASSDGKDQGSTFIIEFPHSQPPANAASD